MNTTPQHNPGAGGQHPPAPGRAEGGNAQDHGARHRFSRVAGCGPDTTDASTSTSSADATTTVGETPDATPSRPVTLSQEEAAQRYLEIVQPYNEALEGEHDGTKAAETIGELLNLDGYDERDYD